MVEYMHIPIFYRCTSILTGELIIRPPKKWAYDGISKKQEIIESTPRPINLISWE